MSSVSRTGIEAGAEVAPELEQQLPEALDHACASRARLAQRAARPRPRARRPRRRGRARRRRPRRPPSRRPPAWRGRARRPRSPVSAPRKRLARGPDQQRQAEPLAQRAEPGEQRRGCPRGACRSRGPGRPRAARAETPAACAAATEARQLVAHLAQHVVEVRALLHRGRLAAQVAEDQRRAGARRDARRARDRGADPTRR